MEEVMDNPDQLPGWISAARGESVNWDDIYNGYGSTVDWPGAHLSLAEQHVSRQTRQVRLRIPPGLRENSYRITLAYYQSF